MERIKRRRFRWIAFASAAAILIVAALLWRWFSTQCLEPSHFLAHVVQIEQTGINETNIQSLGWNLAILGRDHEVRQMDFFPQFRRPPSTVDVEQLDFHVVPWKDGVEQIAADHRVVMIMEDHFVSKHREFVGATLSTFQDAGFTHYAVEAIGPLDTALRQRGYPSCKTGLYTSDPQFGNALRTALDLQFTVLGYDYRFGAHDTREEFAATKLAQLFQDDPATKLLVHAGHSHVLKHATDHGGRWLAARSWEKTGIEPFTIWQWSSLHEARDYSEIVCVLKDRGVSFEEPMLLMPPPPIDCGLQDPPYGLAPVDAIVVHPPDEGVSPAERTVLFPDRMQRIAGRWTTNDWPVVVSAYKQGEPIHAIPLDQVMLRQNETRFVLWIPAGADYEIRVFNSGGVLNSRVETDPDSISVTLEGKP